MASQLPLSGARATSRLELTIASVTLTLAMLLVGTDNAQAVNQTTSSKSSSDSHHALDPVYRCAGADGGPASYGHRPCEGLGRRVATDDARTRAQHQQALATAQATRKLVEDMAGRRKSDEARASEEGAKRLTQPPSARASRQAQRGKDKPRHRRRDRQHQREDSSAAGTSDATLRSPPTLPRHRPFKAIVPKPGKPPLIGQGSAG